ncbi:MAG: prepilin-type N-terminal cleavage/methylation domain-containing protein [Puniceicoccales bacterium]|jgi:prepilin-type N-terminal cleavage/methylation domain-containing protein|nr:prepilin-type N-terminal cleavage/methylation domain-containing protein [Puniceicoccales bacterium]
MINRSCGRRGFLLIEVVVALAVFAVATVVISQSFTNGLLAKFKREASLDEADKLLFLVDQVFEHVKSKDLADSKAILSSGGVMHFPDGSYWQWRMDCRETDVLNLFRITLDLTLPNDKEQYQFYRHMSKWGDVEQRSKSRERFERSKKA